MNEEGIVAAEDARDVAPAPEGPAEEAIHDDHSDGARELTRAVTNLTRVVSNLDELLRRDYPKRAEIERRYMSKQASRRLVTQGIVLLLLIVGVTVYFNVRFDRQQACFEHRLEDSSEVGVSRSDLVEKESAQNKALWLIYAEAAGLIEDPTHPELDQADQDRLNTKLVNQLLEYKREITQIEKKRDKLPVRPYEAGTC